MTTRTKSALQAAPDHGTALARRLLARDLPGALQLVAAAAAAGTAPADLARAAAAALRPSLLAAAGAPLPGREAAPDGWTPTGIAGLIRALRDAAADPDSAAGPLPLELAIVAATGGAPSPRPPRDNGADALDPADADGAATAAAEDGGPEDAPETAVPAAGGDAGEDEDVTIPDTESLLVAVREAVLADGSRDQLHRRAAALLTGACRIVSVDRRELVLGFPPSYTFHRTELMKPEPRRIVTAAARRVLGREVAVRCAVLADAEEAAARSHLVREALRQGARPVRE